MKTKKETKSSQTFGMECTSCWYAVIPKIQATPKDTHIFNALFHIIQDTGLR